MDTLRTSIQRRQLLLGAAGAAALTSPLSVLAQGAEEIVIGGSIPLTVDVATLVGALGGGS